MFNILIKLTQHFVKHIQHFTFKMLKL